MNVHSRLKETTRPMLTVRPPLPAAESRSTEILHSVRTAFSEKGFDGASMQDLARAAGMSVGNFYRYFPSKTAIVAALIELDLAGMEADFQEIVLAPRPFDALRALVRRRIPDHQACGDGKLWSEITAAAQRKPEIGAVACAMEEAVIGYLTRVFAAETGLSPHECARRFAAHAAFIIVLFKSAALLNTRQPELVGPMTEMIFATIDRTLDDIAGARTKA